MNRYDEALADLTRAIELDPDAGTIAFRRVTHLPAVGSFPLPVTIYLSNENIHEQVEAAVENWLNTAGLIIEEQDEPIIGSWFRILRVRVKQAVHSPPARDALLTAAHAAELRMVLAQDAATTATLLQGVAPLVASLQPTKDAVVRAGSVLVVKVNWVVQVRQLTPAQQMVLDHQPRLLSTPEAIITALQLSTLNDEGSLPVVE